MFNKGNNTSGNNAVTAMGIASVTHKATISAAIAITLFAAAETWKGSIIKKRIETAMLTKMLMNRFGMRDKNK